MSASGPEKHWMTENFTEKITSVKIRFLSLLSGVCSEILQYDICSSEGALSLSSFCSALSTALCLSHPFSTLLHHADALTLSDTAWSSSLPAVRGSERINLSRISICFSSVSSACDSNRAFMTEVGWGGVGGTTNWIKHVSNHCCPFFTS